MTKVSFGLAFFIFCLGSTFGLKSESLLISIVICAISICCLLLMPRDNVGTILIRTFFYISPLLISYLLLGFLAHDYFLLIQRFDSAFITSIFLTVIFAAVINKVSENNFYIYIIYMTLIYFFMTIIYKYYYGFWDRDVRFFINGPIVFGWLSGLALLIINLSLSNNKNHIKLYYISTVAMLFSIFWSSSKGPILALIVTYGYYVLSEKKILYTKKYLPIFIIAASVLVLAPDDTASRLIEPFDLDSGQYQDEGSVGVRLLAWESSLILFFNNMIYGVGPTNWRIASEFGFLEYPHNIFLELLSETGIIGFTTFVIVLYCIARSTTNIGKCILIYSVTCMTFSGDVNYIRFIISIPLALALSNYSYRPKIKSHPSLLSQSSLLGLAVSNQQCKIQPQGRRSFH